MAKKRYTNTAPLPGPKALLATIMPSTGVHAWFFRDFLETLFSDQYGIFEGRFILKESSVNIDVNRDFIIKQFLGQTAPVGSRSNLPQCDWLVMVDSDQKWDAKDMFTAIKHAAAEGHQIISGMYHRINYTTQPWSTNYAYWDFDGNALTKEFDKNTGPVRVSCVPAGALIIHRDALIKIRDEFEKRRADSPPFNDSMEDDDKMPHKGGESWFLADNGGGMREDIAFCARATLCEVPIYADPRWKLGHIKALVI